MNLVAPFGFYGAGNIGDEATLQGFARLLSGWRKNVRVSVASRDPLHTARVEPSFRYFKAVGRDPRRWWAKYRSDAFVFPGGTPIMDVLGQWPLCELVPLIRAAEDHRKPVLFVGTGTERLEREESKRLFADVIAPRVRHWSVRCARDKERLTDYGVTPERVTVAADMAWLIESQSLDYGKQFLEGLGITSNEKFVGVNINSELFMLKKEPQLFEKIGQALDAVIECHGFRVLFLCNETRVEETFDKATSLAIQGCMKHWEKTLLVPNEYRSPEQMMSIIGCCEATISSRLHFCLFSALQGVPFLGIQRSDKVEDLCWDLKWNYGVSLGELNVMILASMFSTILEKRSSLSAQLRVRVKEMCGRAERNVAPLESLGALVRK
jgi:polysaccharide pyruvyl transferase WcaK-like protein